MKRIATVALVVVALAVSACNTVRGVGRDVSSVGDAVERAAQ